MEIQAFTEWVGEILIRNFPDREFEVLAQSGVIVHGPMRFGMANFHSQYMRNPVDAEKFEEFLVENFRQSFELVSEQGQVMPEIWEDAKPRLRLQLAHGRIDQLNSALQFPFSDSVFSSVVIDAPSGYAYVRAVDAEGWGQTAVDLIEIAQKNLLEASKDMRMTMVPGENPLVVIQSGDGYDAARVLLPEIRTVLIGELMKDPQASIYVGVPNRDFLIAWPSNVPAALHENLARTVREDAFRQPHPLCDVPLLVTRESIKPLPQSA